MNNNTWYEEIKAREGKVVDNIRKSVGNEAEGRLKTDSAVQFESRGLAELSEDELVALLSRAYSASLQLTDGNSLKLTNQHIDLIKTELKKRT